MGSTLLRAVTIDFHDTLFQCDAWFELEVRELPTQFHHWLTEEFSEEPAALDSQRIREVYRRIRRTAIESGIEVDSVECVSRVFREVGVEIERSNIERGVDILMKATLASAMPRPGAVELIRELRGHGLKVGVISNAIHHSFLEWALERHALDTEVNLVMSSARAGYYKSRVELYQLASDELGALPGDIVHVGDSYRFDVAGAAAAGMRTVWLSRDDKLEGSIVPDLIVDSLEGLAPRLLARFGDSTRVGRVHAV